MGVLPAGGQPGASRTASSRGGRPAGQRRRLLRRQRPQLRNRRAHRPFRPHPGPAPLRVGLTAGLALASRASVAPPRVGASDLGARVPEVPARHSSTFRLLYFEGMTPLRIDVWSDIACPWCYIGRHRLRGRAGTVPGTRRGRRSTGDRSSWIRRRHRERDPAVSHVHRLANKYGTSERQAQAMIDRVASIGRDEGIAFDFDRIRPGNSFDAHRLLQSARAARSAAGVGPGRAAVPRPLQRGRGHRRRPEALVPPGHRRRPGRRRGRGGAGQRRPRRRRARRRGGGGRAGHRRRAVLRGRRPLRRRRRATAGAAARGVHPGDAGAGGGGGSERGRARSFDGSRVPSGRRRRW